MQLNCRKVWLLALLLAGCDPTIADDDELKSSDYLQTAVDLLETAPVFDGHNDLPWVIRDRWKSSIEAAGLASGNDSDTDIPRLRQGRVGVQIWSVFVPSSFAPLEAVTAQLEQIDLVIRMIEEHPRDLKLATSTSDIEKALAEGKIASLLGMEGGHTIVDSLGVLRAYYSLGVRSMTLTHYHSHGWADSATGDRLNEGLSEFGEQVIREINRLGMIIDLSHVSDETMNDVLDVTSAPVIFSHSSARALTRHVRNVPDEVLARMPENGGVVMVTFIPSFVSEERRQWADGMTELLANVKSAEEMQQLGIDYRKEHGEPPIATLSQVADHVEHVASVAGIDHVGISGDFYGATGDDLVQGLEDVSRYPHLVAELLRRGWSHEDIEKLAFGNMMRVLRQVESTATIEQDAAEDSGRSAATLAD